MSYIISRKNEDLKEYLQAFAAGKEEWSESPIGCKTYPTRKIAQTVCDAIRTRRKESYEVEQV